VTPDFISEGIGRPPIAPHSAPIGAIDFSTRSRCAYGAYGVDPIGARDFSTRSHCAYGVEPIGARDFSTRSHCAYGAYGVDPIGARDFSARSHCAYGAYGVDPIGARGFSTRSHCAYGAYGVERRSVVEVGVPINAAARSELKVFSGLSRFAACAGRTHDSAVKRSSRP
jgi:hypothetical protein